MDHPEEHVLDIGETKHDNSRTVPCEEKFQANAGVRTKTNIDSAVLHMQGGSQAAEMDHPKKDDFDVREAKHYHSRNVPLEEKFQSEQNEAIAGGSQAAEMDHPKKDDFDVREAKHCHSRNVPPEEKFQSEQNEAIADPSNLFSIQEKNAVKDAENLHATLKKEREKILLLKEKLKECEDLVVAAEQDIRKLREELEAKCEENLSLQEKYKAQLADHEDENQRKDEELNLKDRELNWVKQKLECRKKELESTQREKLSLQKKYEGELENANQKVNRLEKKLKEQYGNANGKDNGPEADGNGRFQKCFELWFKCVGFLGKGSYGVVFEAQHLLDKAHYAVKRVTVTKKKESEMIHREVQALAKVNHPNIVRYHFSWEEVHPAGWQKGIDKQYNSSDGSVFEKSECSSSDSVVFEASKRRSQENISGSSTGSECTKTSSDAKQHPSQETDAENESEVMTDASQEVFVFIQMELCSKTNLKDWLDQNSHERNHTKVGKMFQQIVEGLYCLHSKNLMHRDLKPANIFMAENESVKIGDFGLVREVFQEAQQVSGCTQSASTKQPRQHSQGVGTKLYMSPEQDSTKSYDCKVDIFSLGLIYLELLHPCHTAHEREKVIGDARMQKFPNNFAKEWPEEHAMIVKMTSSDPDQRPSSKDILYEINKDE